MGNNSVIKSKRKCTVTFHFSVAALYRITSDLAGPPGPSVELSPHQVIFQVLQCRGRPFLWAVGLTRMKNTFKNLLYNMMILYDMTEMTNI